VQDTVLIQQYLYVCVCVCVGERERERHRIHSYYRQINTRKMPVSGHNPGPECH